MMRVCPVARSPLPTSALIFRVVPTKREGPREQAQTLPPMRPSHPPAATPQQHRQRPQAVVTPAPAAPGFLNSVQLSRLVQALEPQQTARPVAPAVANPEWDVADDDYASPPLHRTSGTPHATELPMQRRASVVVAELFPARAAAPGCIADLEGLADLEADLVAMYRSSPMQHLAGGLRATQGLRNPKRTGGGKGQPQSSRKSDSQSLISAIFGGSGGDKNPPRRGTNSRRQARINDDGDTDAASTDMAFSPADLSKLVEPSVGASARRQARAGKQKKAAGAYDLAAIADSVIETKTVPRGRGKSPRSAARTAAAAAAADDLTALVPASAVHRTSGKRHYQHQENEHDASAESGDAASPVSLLVSGEFVTDMMALTPEQRIAAMQIPAMEVALLRDLADRLHAEVAAASGGSEQRAWKQRVGELEARLNAVLEAELDDGGVAKKIAKSTTAAPSAKTRQPKEVR